MECCLETDFLDVIGDDASAFDSEGSPQKRGRVDDVGAIVDAPVSVHHDAGEASLREIVSSSVADISGTSHQLPGNVVGELGANPSLDVRGRAHQIESCWRDPVVEVLGSHWSSLRPQRRKLVVDSLLTGTGVEMYSLVRGGMIDIELRVCVESKLVAWIFATLDQPGQQRRGHLPQCWFTCLRQLVTMGEAHCRVCGGAHAAPRSPADLLCAGIVCKPFSYQWSGRWAAGSEAHSDFDIGGLVLEYIRLTGPRLVLLENVMGWNTTTKHDKDGKTPMERILQALAGHGYAVQAITLDTEVWSQMSRPRIYIMAARLDLHVGGMSPHLQVARDRIVSCMQTRARQPPSRMPVIRPGDDEYSAKQSILAAMVAPDDDGPVMVRVVPVAVAVVVVMVRGLVVGTRVITSTNTSKRTRTSTTSTIKS